MQIIEFVRHLDKHIGDLIAHFGPWSYLILFLIIFAETGLVVMPFLPGDTLLFAAGMAAAGLFPGAELNIFILLVTLSLAPLVGDTVNYHMGRYFGPRVFKGDGGRFFKKSNLEKTQAFFAKHGGKAVIIARWVPVVRTFAPFVAGMGSMRYKDFFAFSLIGALLWVWVCTLAGYFLGQIPIVRANFEYAMLALIFASGGPVLFDLLKHRREAKREAAALTESETRP
ncbi:DedA family protein [bacterium]|nr:MAG: DedA family protein [bacterium]